MKVVDLLKKNMNISKSSNSNNKNPDIYDFFGGRSDFFNFQNSFFGNSRDNIILENIYDTISKEIANVNFIHKDSNNKVVLGSDLNFLFQRQFNNIQSPYEFQYTMIYNLLKFGNSIAIPDIKEIRSIENGYSLVEFNINSIQVLDMEQYDFGFGYVSDEFTDEKYLKICKRNTSKLNTIHDDENNDTLLIPYSEIIHLRLNPSNVFNGDRIDVFNNLKNYTSILDKNILNLKETLSLSGISGILKMNGVMGDDENNRKRLESFKRSFLNGNSSGIVALGREEEFETIDFNHKKLSIDEFNMIKKTILDFYGINESILNGNFSEDEYASFFKKSVSPLIKQFSQELNRKLLTKEQFKNGEKIIAIRNIFNGLTISQLSKAFHWLSYDGHISPNEVRNEIGLEPYENGDSFFSNLNAVPLNINGKPINNLDLNLDDEDDDNSVNEKDDKNNA